MNELIFQHDGLVFDHAEGEFKTLKEFLYSSAQNVASEYSNTVDFHNRQQKDFPKVILDDLYQDDYLDVYLEDLSKHGNTFPQLLLYSIMIMACSLFESSIRLVFESMNHFNKTDLQWDKLKGSVVHKTVKLLKAIDLRLEDEKEYIGEFENFYMVRNCIVHNNGSIDNYRGKAKLLEYARRTGIISDDDSEQTLELKQSYCEKVCETFESFFTYLSLDYQSKKKSA